MRTSPTARLGCALLVLSCAACGAGAKTKAVDKTLDVMSDTDRRQTFEATARVLDTHPGYVDDFYAIARRHPPMLERFLANAARDLREPALAGLTVSLLAEHADSVEQVLAQGTPTFAKNQEDRAAVRRALDADAAEAIDMLTDDPDVLAHLLVVTLATIEKKPRARQAVYVAMKKERKRVLAFVEEDKELVTAIGQQMLREAVKDKPALATTLRAAKILPSE